MKAISRILSSFFIATISLAQGQENELAESRRFIRGNENNPVIQSFVIPLDSQKGVSLDPIGNNATKFSGVLPWFSRIQAFQRKHISAVTHERATYDLLYENPIVAFGTSAGGTPLYVGQDYSFGIYVGTRLESENQPAEFVISAYLEHSFGGNRTHITPDQRISVPIPRKGTSEWKAFVENGYKAELSDTATGLNISLRFLKDVSISWWDTHYGTPYVVTVRASNPNYYYKIEAVNFSLNSPILQTLGPGVYMHGGPNGSVVKNVDASAPPAANVLFTMNFDQRPPWRSVFIHQPHFDGKPLPSAYQGKSLEELLQSKTRVEKDLGPVAESYSQVNNSPELRSHPILDRLVEDMGRNPLALSNYVQNEIELTDAISYNDQGQVNEESINAGGINRGALATYLEKQGNPAEQCALLIYLLRKAGVPAVYVFPAKDELLMLDARMSKLLRMQLSGLKNPEGKATLPHLIPVNYPWVAAKVTEDGKQKWVHLFPWLKDTEIKEGLDLFAHMPKEANTALLWIKRYLHKDPEIMSLQGSGENTVAHLFPKYVSKQLEKNHPGISINDLGVKIRDRKNQYSRWKDFPQPLAVTEDKSKMVVRENLSFDANNFDTVSIKIFSDRNQNGVSDAGEPQIEAGPLRTLDLHNRRLVVHFKQTSGDNHNMFLTLAPFHPGVTGTSDYQSDPDLLKKQEKSALLGTQDLNLVVNVNVERHRTLPSTFFTSSHWDTPMGLNNDLRFRYDVSIKKGDTNALCLMPGRVTKEMVRIHTDEYALNRERSQADSSVQSEGPDQAIAYMMGMSYYERVTRFREQLEKLTKTSVVSNFAHGFAKIGAQRNRDGKLINNGEINLVAPQVDMFFRTTAVAGNGRLRPDQNLPSTVPMTDFLALALTDVAAQEHAIINEMFEQKEAAST